MVKSKRRTCTEADRFVVLGPSKEHALTEDLPCHVLSLAVCRNSSKRREKNVVRRAAGQKIRHDSQEKFDFVSQQLGDPEKNNTHRQ